MADTREALAAQAESLLVSLMQTEVQQTLVNCDSDPLTLGDFIADAITVLQRVQAGEIEIDLGPAIITADAIGPAEQGWWVEPIGISGDPAYGPYADELDASLAMDRLELSDSDYKIVWRDTESD